MVIAVMLALLHVVGSSIGVGSQKTSRAEQDHQELGLWTTPCEATPHDGPTMRTPTLNDVSQSDHPQDLDDIVNRLEGFIIMCNDAERKFKQLVSTVTVIVL